MELIVFSAMEHGIIAKHGHVNPQRSCNRFHDAMFLLLYTMAAPLVYVIHRRLSSQKVWTLEH
jgi:hypothetical protein